MGKKYNSKIIFDYIVGNDLDGYSIDELENDSNFMMDVIKITRDKRMHNLCSDDIKKNCTFVEFLISFFKDDLDFIISIADNYIQNPDVDDVDKEEIKIFIGNFYDNDKYSALEKYKVSSYSFYNSVVNDCYSVIRKMSDSERESCSLFRIIELTFFDRKVIKDYFAKNLVYECLCENLECRFADLIHYYFNEVSDLESYGETKFLLFYLSSSDRFLRDYLSVYPNLLESYCKDIEKVKKDWNNYNNRLNFDRVQQVIDYASEYLRNECLSFYTDFFDIILDAVTPLGLKSVFDRYISLEDEQMIEDDNTDLFSEYFDDNFDNDSIFECNSQPTEEEKKSFEYLSFINKIRNFTKKIFSKNRLINPINEEESNSPDKVDKGRRKVIQYDFINRCPIDDNDD